MAQLVVLGAGPKGIAISTKAFALRKRGIQVPEVVLIDKSEVAANWTGKYGLTHGRSLLCTPPDKDLGFPYCSAFGREVDHIMQEFSWQRYKIDQGTYREWIDRGRYHPTHLEWARYLQWAGNKAGAKVVNGEITDNSIERGENIWTIKYRSCNPLLSDNVEPLNACGIVVTGPGGPISLRNQADHFRITNSQTFWHASSLSRLKRLRAGRVAVIGSGETAATVVLELSRILQTDIQINLIHPRPQLPTRSQSGYENIHYSDPSEYIKWPEAMRLEFLKATDRGVVSPTSIAQLNRTDNVIPTPGRAVAAKIVGGKVRISLELNGEQLPCQDYDHVVIAIGFNPLTFLSFFGQGVFSIRGRKDQRVLKISRKIGSDLSMDGIMPKVHLPMLANIKHGPGFPNLSCLSLLSDRILSSYCG